MRCINSFRAPSTALVGAIVLGTFGLVTTHEKAAEHHEEAIPFDSEGKLLPTAGYREWGASVRR